MTSPGASAWFVPDDNDAARQAAEELTAIALRAGVPPPHAIRVSSDNTGSRATAGGRRICIRRSEVGSPWMRGTLAHEYAHVLDWADHRRRIQTLAGLLLAATTVIVLVAVGLQQQQNVGVIAMATTAGTLFLGGAAILRRGEYRADAIAAELLGAEHRGELLAMFDDIAENRNPPATWWAPHPAPARRAAAVRGQRRDEARNIYQRKT